MKEFEAIRSSWTDSVNDEILELERQLVWALEMGMNETITSNEMNVLLTAIETELMDARKNS